MLIYRTALPKKRVQKLVPMWLWQRQAQLFGCSKIFKVFRPVRIPRDISWGNSRLTATEWVQMPSILRGEGCAYRNDKLKELQKWCLISSDETVFTFGFWFGNWDLQRANGFHGSKPSLSWHDCGGSLLEMTRNLYGVCRPQMLTHLCKCFFDLSS